MEVKFTVTKEERKALVAAVSELTGCASAYQGAPSFAFAVGDYIIDRSGTLVYDERTETAELRALLTGLTERGFVFEGDIDEIAPAVSEQTAEERGALVADSDENGEQDVIQLTVIKLHQESSESGDGITAYYLIYSPDDSDMIAALSHETLALFTDRADKCIICADVCYLSEEEMVQLNIEFRKIPRDWNLIPYTVQEQIRAIIPERSEQWGELAPDADDSVTDAAESGEDANSENERTPRNGDPFAAALVSETPDTLVIEVPLTGFTRTALDNLEKMVTNKAALILKAIGVPESDEGDDLPIEQTETTLRFPWFPLPASKDAIDAYGKFICALCELAKKQKRVTMKESQIDSDSSEKFAMRCFLLRLGFIGNEYKSARQVLLSKLSGNGSFKSGDHKRGSAPVSATAANSGGDNTEAISVREGGNNADNAATGGENAAPERCGQCHHHCYYTDGLLRTNAGDIVDTSKRTPEKYTHYCLGAPSGFRKIKSASDWSGFESPASWCPLSAETKGQSVRESHITAHSGEDDAEDVSVREGDPSAENGAAGGDKGALRDCLACGNSLSEPAENDGDADRLFCVVKQTYVSEDGSCDEFNS